MGVFCAASGIRRIATAAFCLAAAVAVYPAAGAGIDRDALPSAPPIALGGDDDRPTSASLDFCRRFPAECEVDLTEPLTVTLTPATWSLLRKVNGHVNDTIKQVADNVHWGVNDRWDFPDDGRGDCEDLQLLKRRLLAEAGLPRRAMRMTVVIDKRDMGHAVLTVLTDRGDLVLDNDVDAVLPWNETGYEFIKREGQHGRAWVALGGEKARIVMASKSVRERIGSKGAGYSVRR